MLKNEDILEQPEQDFEQTIDSFVESNSACSISDIENMVNKLLISLPKMNRNAIRFEMSQMVVGMEQNPTTYDLNKGLSLSQEYINRLSEILSFAQSELKVRKRCADMLLDAVNLISKASSADKRRGEFVMKYPVMVVQVEACEIFVREIEQIYSNMKLISNSISRQVSVVQMQIQLGERRSTNTTGKDFMNNSEAEEVNKTMQWENF